LTSPDVGSRIARAERGSIVSFLDTVVRAKNYLRGHGRVSLRGLQREFGLDAASLDELVEELVTVQQVAALQGKVLAWIGAPGDAVTSPEPAVMTRAAPAAEPGERRQLTVLFCDLADSTWLASQLDPEDWRDVVHAYQQAAARAVARFDGHVAQYLGDGLLVYFGYPQAHEDDAERAVRGGLAMLEAVTEANDALEARHGIRLTLRVGIHTGVVVVGEMAGGASHGALALGETTNLAARLQAEAEPNSVVLSGVTLHLVPGIFATRDLGARTVKGVREPVRVHQALRATGVRSRLDVASAEDLTPLVGRDQELGLLLGRWEQVQDGLGQVVLVSGEAGIGKSRLIQALRERLADTAHTWLECHGTSFTRDSAFLPVIELLRHGLRLEDDEPVPVKREKLMAALEQNALPADGLPLLASLLSIPLPEPAAPPSGTPERAKRLTRDLLLEWLLRLGRVQPLILVMEDLHWMDPSTLELISMVVEQAPTASVLALLTHRPGFEPPWAARAHVTPVSVGRLSRRQAAAMVERVAGERRLPEAVVRAIVERTDGIPLFVEELTKALLDADVVGAGGVSDAAALELAIPATLQDSLTARLDRSRAAKEVAQLAATVGREFRYEVLAAASPLDEGELQRGLDSLVDAELLYQRGAVPHAVYVFKHALVQETAYRSLLKPRRQQFHLQIARALERGFAGTAEERPEELAHHYAQAGLPEPAIPWWEKAGQRAVQRSANVEAVRHLRRGLAALERVAAGPERDDRELRLRTLLGIALIATEGYSAPAVLDNFARAREVCEALGDTPARFPVLLGLFRFYLLRSDREATARLVEQCLELAQRTQDSGLLFFAELAAGMRAFYAGEHARSRERLAGAWARYEPERRDAYTLAYGQDPSVTTRMHAAWNEWYLGYPDRARRLASEGLELAEASGHPFGLAGGLSSASLLWRLCGDAPVALRHAEACIAISREQGFSTWLWAGMLSRGTALGLLGHTDEAIAEVVQATAAARSIGSQLFVPRACCELAALYLAAGRPAEALRALDEARVLAAANLDVWEEAEIHRLTGEVRQRAEPSADVEHEFRRAVDLARERGARSLELRAVTSLARLWQGRGERARARELLEPVVAGFTEGFDTADLKQASALLSGLI
jgi:class 3 adenylate cyclase/predicted ATPase